MSRKSSEQTISAFTKTFYFAKPHLLVLNASAEVLRLKGFISMNMIQYKS